MEDLDSVEKREARVEKGMSPVTLLVICTTVQLITYLDRGIISTYLTYIQNDFHLSSLQAGTLAGAYMVGYMGASPIFAHFAARAPPLLLMGIGLTVWIGAVVCTGLSLEYGTILLARTATGVGEASFACLAPPLIDSRAPKEKKSLWMAIFYINIPVGYAMGYLLAGQWHSSGAVHGQLSWRAPFIAVGLSLIPFVIFLFIKCRDPTLTFAKRSEDGVPSDTDTESKEGDDLIIGKGSQDMIIAEGGWKDAKGDDPTLDEPLMGFTEQAPEEDMPFWDKMKILLNNRIYLCIVLGYAAQTFVVGGFAYWGVKYVEKALKMDESTATLTFGGLTVVTGVLGTATGGFLLDRMRAQRVSESGGTSKMDDAERAMFIMFVCAIASLPCILLGIGLNSPAAFFPLVGIGEFLLFMCLTPINSGIVWIIPYKVAPLGMAMSVLCNHLLGDAISPIVIGALLDSTHNNWRSTFVLISMWLIWPILMWGPAWHFARKELKRNAYESPMVASQDSSVN